MTKETGPDMDRGVNAGSAVQENRFGPENPAQILPLVTGSGNRRLLTEWIAQQPAYEPVRLDTESETLPTTAFDLCIFDQTALETYGEELRERKQTAVPVLVPYLLLYPEGDESVIEADPVDLADTVLTETVDEIVSLPLKKAKLAWRVQALLRLRSQSLRLKEEKSQLRRFKQAADEAGHAVYITDTDGKIEYANDAFERITGYDATEVIGKTPRVLNSGEMPDEYFEDLWETVTSGETWEEEVINRRKNGEIYYAQQTIAPIVGPDGISSFVAIQSDISEYKRLENELRESKQQYESLFNSIRDPILVTDTDRRIINCNPAFTELFGYELAEIEGKHTKYVYESEADFEEMGEALAGHTDDPTFTHTVTYEKKSGQTFPGETNVFYLRDADDETVGFIGIIRDTTKRRDRLKQLQVVDRVLQHNFHNEMNVIQGFAENIQQDAGPPFRGYAETIRETGEDLLETVDKQREITKFLSDPPVSEDIDIVRVCTGVADRISSANEGVTIVNRTPDEAVVTVTPMVERAIEELVMNSIEHAETETPEVHLRVETTPEEVTVQVIDENPHIPEMERKVLTGEEGFSSLYHGSGMGLWLVTLIVNHSNGRMEFDRNDPIGNVVTIRLPAA